LRPWGKEKKKEKKRKKKGGGTSSKRARHLPPMHELDLASPALLENKREEKGEGTDGGLEIPAARQDGPGMHLGISE